MATKVKEGKYIDYTPSGSDVTAGDVIVLSELVAIADADIADGELGALNTQDTYAIDGDATETFAIGDEVFWDVADANVTLLADTGTNKRIGYAVSARGAVAGDVLVKLSQI